MQEYYCAKCIDPADREDSDRAGVASHPQQIRASQVPKAGKPIRYRRFNRQERFSDWDAQKD